MQAGGTARPSAGIKRLATALTVVLFAAVVVIPYWVDRAFRRWWEANRPVPPFGARLRRMQARFRARQDSLADEARIAAALGELIDAAVPPSRTR